MLALGTFLAAFLITYSGNVLLLRIRLKRGFIDVPNERSSHEVPKPRFGGIAIVGAFTVVFSVLLATQPGFSNLLPLLLGGLIVFAAGALDDWRSMPVRWRFLAQIAAAAVVVGFGHSVDHIFVPLVGTLELGVVAVPFTMLFIMASINFYNFMDGIDGLAAGSAFIVAGFLALIGYMLGHSEFSLVCLVLAGCAIGFLQFNFPPSKLFMGDGGSTFLGFFFGSIAVMGNGLIPEIPFFIPVLMLSSLYLDAGLTLLLRAVRGEKVLRPHHSHYYQRLLSLGLNHKQVTVLEYGLTLLLGVSALIFFKAGGFFPIFLTLCWVAVFTVLILKIRSLERGDRLFWERRTLLVIAGDLVLIAVAYFGAYFLRMNFRFTEAEGMAVLKAFPIVVVVRSACFYAYGLYRGVWKYTSTPDVVRIIKAVTTGSAIILVLLVLFYRFVAFPRSMFVIEFFLLIIAIGGSRFASRLFHEYGKEPLGGYVKKVAIIGAGDYGERLGREIRNTEGKRVSVVCYIDDNPDKGGLMLQGVPILGPVDELADICERFEVESLVLAINNLPESRLRRIVTMARESGIPLETREGRFAEKPAPAAVLFDRVSRELDRKLPATNSEETARFYDGKRVLVTNGGEAVGPALARTLIELGARLTVQVASPWESKRFGDLGESGEFFIGNLEREVDAAKMLQASVPDVVFHCVALHRQPSVNTNDYMWRRVARATDSLYRVLTKYPIESLVFVGIWDGMKEDAYAASLAAIGETLSLNSADLLPATPKVLRLPALLTETALRRIADGPPLAAGMEDRWYGMLETEAVTLCLDAAASYKGRAILVPRYQPQICERDVDGILRNRAAVTAAGSITVDEPPAVMLPPEEAKPSILAGAKEVVSPLFPANAELLALVSECLQSQQAETREQSLEVLHTMLFERQPREIRTLFD